MNIRIATAIPRKDVQATLLNVYLITFTSKRNACYTTHERNLIRTQDEAERFFFHALISLEITFHIDYLFCVLNYTVYRE